MANGGPNLKDALFISDAIHNLVYGTKEVVEIAGEELKEVATSGSALGTTESVAKEVLPEVAKAFFNPENMCHVTDGLFNNASTVKDVCTLADAPEVASSYLSYLGPIGTALSVGLTGLGLYKLRNARATAKQLINDDLNAVLKDSTAGLEFIEAIKNDEVKVGLINKLSVVEIKRLLDLEATSKGTLAALAKVSSAKFARQLELAVAPDDLESVLVEKSTVTPSSIVGTSNAASSTQVQPTVELADTILTSDAGQAILAKIRSGEKAKAALAQMDETALKALAKNATKLATGIAGMNDATVAATLEKIISMSKPKVTVSLTK